MITPKVLVFGGALREGSFNHKVALLLADAARAVGAQVTLMRLRDYPLPVYDGDDEARAGLPEQALRLKRLFWEHQGLLISTPEYNSSLPGGLKNMIDWVSRPGGWGEWRAGDAAKPEREPALSCFADKIAGITSASPGVLGGLRSLTHLRQVLGNIKVLVLPEQIGIARANEAFLDTGKLKDAAQQGVVDRIGAAVVGTIRKLRGG